MVGQSVTYVGLDSKGRPYGEGNIGCVLSRAKIEAQRSEGEPCAAGGGCSRARLSAAVGEREG